MSGSDANHSLQTYYTKFFPVEDLCQLLARGWRFSTQLNKRELCIETATDCYIRWLSVSSGNDLRNLFIKYKVAKFHTGAIFSTEPCFKKKGLSMEAVEREFVCDIDVNDYETWGVDANDIESCDDVWKLVAFGMYMVRHVLCNHFGFTNILMVYSGRRGAHLSVYDSRACALTDEARAAIVSYLQPTGKKGKSGRFAYRSILLCPGFKELFKSDVLPFWMNMCLKSRERGGMGVLDGRIERECFMELFGDTYAPKTAELMSGTGVQMWNKLSEYANNSRFKADKWSALQETVMCYVWPRLDGAVSTHRNHLSKSVFSVHPKTDRICVPISGDWFSFDPTKCPTYTKLVAGDSDTRQSFQASVLVLRAFTKALSISKSESWVPSAMDVVPNRQYSMISPKRPRLENGPQRGLSDSYRSFDKRRVYANTVRVFCALASGSDPEIVSIFFYTELASPLVEDVPPGYAPPFRIPGRFPVASFVDAVRDAYKTPGEELVVSRVYVCVLFDACHTEKKECADRMQNMEERLRVPDALTNINATWTALAQESMIKDRVKEAWGTSHVHLQ